MKVICISEGQPINEHVFVPDIVIGSEYTVIEESWDEDLGEYYCLEEFGYRYGYSQIHFATVSTIDETEMIREFNHEPA